MMIRPVSQILFEALSKNVWPEGPAALTDFGIDTREHFEALSGPVQNGEITLEELDRALGNGPLITKLARGARSNPHKAIEFRTPWDDMGIGRAE
jgi:hypothetical protein